MEARVCILPLHCQVIFHRFPIIIFVFDLVGTHLELKKTPMLLNILTKIKANREYSNRRTWAANVWFQNENGNSAKGINFW